MDAELHRLGRTRTLLVHGAGDLMILSSHNIETQLTSREVASLVERWLTYKLVRDGRLPAVLPDPPDEPETPSADQRDQP